MAPDTAARLVIDTDVFLALESANLRVELGRTGPWPIVITDVVWSELVDDCPSAYVHGMKTLLQALAGQPTVMMTETREARALGEMAQQEHQTEGGGELSVIAFALSNPDATVVLKDKRAVVRAVEELRERILSFHGMLAWLVARQHLTQALANRLATTYLQRNQGLARPLWWPR